MSMGITFFSSPLQATYYPPLQSRTSFFTPPHYKTSSSSSSSFKPSSPSPLRTSRNVNLMSNPFSTKIEADQKHNENSDSITNGDSNSEVLFFLNQNETNNRHVGATRAIQFQYESRARSSSPSFQLQTHMIANRESRKKGFLNRLRNKRDDARFERSGDQMLRMDWLNERKAWEQEMAQEEVVVVMEEHDDLEMDMEVEVEDTTTLHDMECSDVQGLSPTEDKEIEELVSYFERESDYGFDDAEEDYDALFMQVMDESHASSEEENAQHVLHVKSDVDGTDVDMV